MTTIAPKYVLVNKGESKAIESVKQLLVNLHWTSAVDLDLCVFYEPKDGSKPGGVTFRGLGDLNNFPFMKLKGDEGVGKTTEGEECEELKIVNLDKMKKLYLCAVNYTDAQKNQSTSESSFANLKCHMALVDDKGVSPFDVPLDNPKKGTVAHVATIDNSSAVGAQLIKVDEVYQFNQFVEVIPGAMVLAK